MCPERRERLLHQSDFTAPSEYWIEGKVGKSLSFRRNGYFHIAVEPPAARIRSVGIPIDNFKVTVDAEFVDTNSGSSLYGIVFRTNKDDTFYSFNVEWNGYFSLLFYGDKKWDRITPGRTSEFVKGARPA